MVHSENTPPGSVLILHGPNGVGKDLIQRMLVDRYDMFPINTGQFIRNRLQTDPELARLVSAGQLVPSQLIYKHIESQLWLNGNKKPIVMNGAPRADANELAGQCHHIHKLLVQRGIQNIVVITIDAPDYVLEMRRSARVAEARSQDQAVRSDDLLVTFTRRLATFRQFGHLITRTMGTKPLVTVTEPVNADQTPEQVLSAIWDSYYPTCHGPALRIPVQQVLHQLGKPAQVLAQ